jgi:purine-binding chemotaxis protein CheW
MSENDRMDRAERIRRLREGQRDADSDSEQSTDDGPAPAEERDGDGGGPDGSEDAGRDGRPETGASGESAASAAGSATGETDAETDGNEPTPAEVVEAVAGTAASVPSPAEMEAAVEGAADVAGPSADDSTGSNGAAGAEEAAGSDGAEAGSDDEGESGPAGVASGTTAREVETRVLEFALDGEWYCLDIEYIEEIVKQESVTRVPNTPEFVEGVVDLRGQITTILNPKVPIGKDDDSAGDLIVVFDDDAFDDQGAVGWVVDDVRRVSPVTDDQIKVPPMGEEYINGVIDREDEEEFVVWTTPDLALEEAG